MALIEMNKWLFKKHPIRFKKLLIVFVVFICFAEGLEFLLHHTPSYLFSIKEYTVEDIDFSDIYYQTRSQDSAKKDVVLINIGSFPVDSIRYKLLGLVDKLKGYKPKVIGLDIVFTPKEDTAAFEAINYKLDSLFQNDTIVIGASYGEISEFPFPKNSTHKQKINFGFVNLPGVENNTRRQYYYNSPGTDTSNHDTTLSFACKVYKAGECEISKKPVGSTFILRYTSNTDAGFYNALDNNNEWLIDSSQDFPGIEADNLLNGNKVDSSLIRSKYVIIGSLGNPMNNRNDIKDKHRVPVNFQLFNRLPTMPGAVVHANALQMLINGKYVKEIDGWWYKLITGFIIFFYLFVFNVLHKIRPILLKLTVEIIFLVISITFITWLGSLLLGHFKHLNIGKILFYIVLLIEYKMFAFEFYDYMEKQNLHKIFSFWFSSIKYFFRKNILSHKVKIKHIEIKKNENDEA